MKSEYVCMYYVYVLWPWVEEGLVGGGGEAARVSRLPLWCERRGLAGMGGGGFPVCDVNITSQMWKCVQSENSFVLL
jgi:hypothetical protein